MRRCPRAAAAAERAHQLQRPIQMRRIDEIVEPIADQHRRDAQQARNLSQRRHAAGFPRAARGDARARRGGRRARATHRRRRGNVSSSGLATRSRLSSVRNSAASRANARAESRTSANARRRPRAIWKPATSPNIARERFVEIRRETRRDAFEAAREVGIAGDVDRARRDRAFAAAREREPEQRRRRRRDAQRAGRLRMPDRSRDDRRRPRCASPAACCGTRPSPRGRRARAAPCASPDRGPITRSSATSSARPNAAADWARSRASRLRTCWILPGRSWLRESGSEGHRRIPGHVGSDMASHGRLRANAIPLSLG